MAPWLQDALRILSALTLVLINGFFVAAEFALVKVRPSRVDMMVREKRPYAKTLRWLVRRLDASLSACQLGITMASLGLGWIGEPAVAHLLRPLFETAGIRSHSTLHVVSFIVAFSIITALHLVIGEQAPKIFAIRRPELLAIWCAPPLRFFYFISYPFLISLNWASSVVLRSLGLGGETGHDSHHTEEELRVLLEQSRIHGELSRAEHQLLNAVFEFDDLLTRQVMVPRRDVVCFDLERTWKENLELAQRSQHTRYPVCRGSLDHTLGVVHIKDLLRIQTPTTAQLASIMRPPRLIPESMPISKLLRHFQATRHHMAFVVDEHGTIIGIVTMENVLEQIVGSVEDEFDLEPEEIVPIGSGRFLVLGATPVERIERQLRIDLGPHDSDTLSGLLAERLDRVPAVGDAVQWKEAKAEVREARGGRAEKVEIRLLEAPTASEDGSEEEGR
jgi:CBS domain containing-hemolysin-like protein